MKFWRLERVDLRKKECAAGEAEKSHVRKLKEFSKQGIAIPAGSDFLVPIEDPEAKWRAKDVTWPAKEANKEAERKKKFLPRVYENSDGVIHILNA